jgi:uncharacterized protein
LTRARAQTVSSRTVASSTGAPSGDALRALLAWALAAIVFFAAHTTDTQFSRFWVFGLAFGFVLQRGRFCFASAFRDLFLLGHGRTMKGCCSALPLLRWASHRHGSPGTHRRPGFQSADGERSARRRAHRLGGLLFGVGMVLAGGCVSGSLYRMGEGYVASWVAFAGLMGGLLVSSYTWNWWWETSMSTAPTVWLPRPLGHSGALALTLLALGAAFVGVLWVEHRAGMVLPASRPPEEATESVADDLRALGRKMFVDGWPILIAGAVLGGLNVLLFTAQEPWGFTGEVARWTTGWPGCSAPRPRHPGGGSVTGLRARDLPTAP